MRSIDKALPVLCLFPFLLLACGGPQQSEVELEEPAAPAIEVRTYTVEGEIVELPATNEAGAEIRIHHQPIAGFLAAHGKEMEMGEMTMPFHLGDGIALEGLAPGDAIRFQMEVDWSRDPSDAIIAIDKLPDAAGATGEDMEETGGEEHAGHEM